jgi:predicted transcriptional regulator
MTSVKKQVRQIADELPGDATWEQVRYEIYVREQIAKGEAAIAQGRTVPHEEVKRRFADG